MQPTTPRYASVDGLRGFAALWVVAYHLWNRFYPGFSTQGSPDPAGVPADALGYLTLWTLGFGYSGVTLFFVLSGFCIHLPQARRGEYRVSLPAFAARRFWRLYPAYLASVALSAFALVLPKLLLALGGGTFDWWAESHAVDALINAAFLQQFWPDSLGFNGVYWTLVYEVQFYCAYPVLLWGVRKFGFAPVGVALLASEVGLAYAPSPVPCFFLNKYFEWFLGVVAAEVVARRRDELPRRLARLCLVLGVAAGAFAATNRALSPLRDLAFAVGYFGLLLTVAGGRGVTHSVLSSGAFAGVGLFSYSLYLIHVPVIDTVWVGVDRLLVQRSQHASTVQWLSLFALPLCVACGYCFYRLFEKPFLAKPAKAS